MISTAKQRPSWCSITRSTAIVLPQASPAVISGPWCRGASGDRDDECRSPILTQLPSPRPSTQPRYPSFRDPRVFSVAIRAGSAPRPWVQPLTTLRELHRSLRSGIERDVTGTPTPTRRRRRCRRWRGSGWSCWTSFTAVTRAVRLDKPHAGRQQRISPAAVRRAVTRADRLHPPGECCDVVLTWSVLTACLAAARLSTGCVAGRHTRRGHRTSSRHRRSRGSCRRRRADRRSSRR